MTDDSAAALPDMQETFLAQLERIDRIIGSICRRNAIHGDEADDVRSWLKTKLIEDDYAVLRKFEGRSSIGTYLTVVLANLFRDYRVLRWGRWRPSAEARRLGELAVQLETLLQRDRLPLEQAIAVLRNSGQPVPEDAELARLAARLPQRPARGPDEPLSEDIADAGRADAAVMDSEAQQIKRHVEQQMNAAMDRLDVEDQVILKLRFWEGMSVANIARALRLEQAPLYRRLERTLKALREELEERGVGREHVATLLEQE